MIAEVRRRLEAHASSYLRRLGCREGPFVVSIKCQEIVHSFRVVAWEAPPPCEVCPKKAESVDQNTPPLPTGLPLSALWLSPLERRIVDALRDRDWTPAEELARLLGESCTGDLRAVTRNLVERCILESAPSKGYRLIKSD